MEILGIDIGGSGIKGAPVNLQKGELAGKRVRFPTPQPSKPEAVAGTVAKIVARFAWKGPVGCTFPAVVKKGRVYTAANMDKDWIGTNGRKLLQATTGCRVQLLNDADAAGIAEMSFGAGKGRNGTVFVLTFGTGIGSALFVDGKLMPNTELGHMEILCRPQGGIEAEHHASDLVRKRERLSWGEWAARVDDFLGVLEALFAPDLFILGGGVSKKHEKYVPLLKTKVEVVPAHLLNDAGIVGAALAAKRLARRP